MSDLWENILTMGFIVIIAFGLLFIGYVCGTFQKNTEHDFKLYSTQGLTYRLGRNTGCINIDGREYKYFFQEIK